MTKHTFRPIIVIEAPTSLEARQKLNAILEGSPIFFHFIGDLVFTDEEVGPKISELSADDFAEVYRNWRLHNKQTRKRSSKIRDPVKARAARSRELMR